MDAISFRPNELNITMSSMRFKNSGLKCFLNFIVVSLLIGKFNLPNDELKFRCMMIEFNQRYDHRLNDRQRPEVIGQIPQVGLFNLI